MEDAETHLRRLAAQHGFTVRVLQPVAGEPGSIRITRGAVLLGVTFTEYEYDAWDALSQALSAFVDD